MNMSNHYMPAQIKSIVNQLLKKTHSSYKENNIIPLYDIVCSHPIRIAEIEDLSFHTAAQFLSSETGQSVPLPENERQELAGFLFIQRYRKTLYGCILVEKKDSIVRRRFSVAHELGHYLLHFLPEFESQHASQDLVFAEGLTYSSNLTDDLPTGKLALIQSLENLSGFNFIENELVEKEANQFAAELLIPESRCKDMYRDFTKKYGVQRPVLIKRLATEFLVSAEAMKWRLMALKLHPSL